MRRYKFNEWPGFPFDQEVLTQMQRLYSDTLAGFFESLGATGPFIVSGLEITSGSIGSGGTVSDGIIYVPGIGLCSFEGGSFPLAPTAIFEVQVSEEPLAYEGGDQLGEIRYRGFIGAGTGDFAALLGRKWWMYLGQNAASEQWVQFYNTSAGTLSYYHNKVGGIVTVIGRVQHNHSASTTEQTWSYNIAATLPAGLRPEAEFYTTTQLEKISSGGSSFVPVIYDVNGSVYTHGGIIVATDGSIQPIFARLATGTAMPWHRVYFQIQL